ncbi:MAG: YkgJ family cysteine cluster protein [Desulfobacterales bacterium]|nr:YkgJ family cysteine cluster protein [Desulfobacterales bacterium]
MNRVENHELAGEKLGSFTRTTDEERFVRALYTSLDEAIADCLERLRSRKGITPRCGIGCSHCCRFRIPLSVVEAHTLSQHIKREFSENQIETLRMRTLQWHAWDGSRPGRHPSGMIEQQMDLSEYEHCCPLLVNGACSAYLARPLVCRTHFVSSHPWYCLAANDPKSTEDEPVAITSILTETSLFSMAIKDHIEETGADFCRSVMLLPHWLAIQMGWDFAFPV